MNHFHFRLTRFIYQSINCCEAHDAQYWRRRQTGGLGMTKPFEGSWLNTGAKLEILEDYLVPYTNIINIYYDSSWYVDAYAGTGEIQLNDGELIDGSTLIALKNHAEDFDKFYFYEVHSGRFEHLYQTIENRFDYEFDVSEAIPEGADFDVARHDDPYIRIMNTDCNNGMRFLAEESNRSSHWFTFVDPEGFGPKWDTIDSLIDRGSMDLLINLQTSGLVMNTGEGTDHAHDSVSDQLDTDDWKYGLSADEIVGRYEERLRERDEWNVVSKALRDPTDNQWRFDMVFSSDNDTARDIMDDVMNKDDLWEKASERVGQGGLGRFSG